MTTSKNRCFQSIFECRELMNRDLMPGKREEDQLPSCVSGEHPMAGANFFCLYPHTQFLFTSAHTENAIVYQGVLDLGIGRNQFTGLPQIATIIRKGVGHRFMRTSIGNGVYGDQIAI
jgi:hypothetical protein